MTTISYQKFLKTMPPCLSAHLPDPLTHLKARQPFRWIVQFYDYDARIHYEVGRMRDKSLEIGLHCESKDKGRNQQILTVINRRLIEIHAQLGATQHGRLIEAEPWDRGWTKVYETYPDTPFTEAYQEMIARRLAAIITCLHPILLEIDAPGIGR